MRLIDYEKARKDVLNILRGKVTTVTAVLVSTAMKASTVDAVEVVRCKDCKHRKEKICFNPCYGMWVGVELKDNDFCSYGERKEK